MEMTRRVFMKSGAAAVVGLGAVPRFLVRAAFAAPKAATKKILVAIFQRGAADGLNMVVPYGEGQYYAMRPSLAIQLPGRGNGETAVDLNGFFGLHPALAALKPLYDAERLAIVHSAGSPDSTRSHFDAQDFMESATPGLKSTGDGWLNRYLKAASQRPTSPFRAVAMARRLPRSLMGDAPAIAMADINEFDVRGGMGGRSARAGFEALYERGVRDLLHGTGRETLEAMRMLKAADPARYQPANGAEYPPGPFGMAIQQIAQLIKGDRPAPGAHEPGAGLPELRGQPRPLPELPGIASTPLRSSTSWPRTAARARGRAHLSDELPGRATRGKFPRSAHMDDVDLYFHAARHFR